MDIDFSGWKAVEEKRPLRAGEEPTAGRTYTMYHGTHLKHAKNIISQGFRPSAVGLLGAGVYVSRDKNKAMCYPQNTDKMDSVVFKLRVRVGKVKKIDCNNHPLQQTWHQAGFDSAWVPPKCGMTAIKSGREEDCVWDPSRIEIVDVACCMDTGTRHALRQLITTKRRTKRRTNRCANVECICQNVTSMPSHPLQNCWACNERICPFQKKHVCPG